MKKFIQLLILAAFLNSCTSTKNYSNRKDADNALQDVVQQLNKNANNQSARKALPILYTDVQHTHLANVKYFNAANKDGSYYWNDIILEYQALQNAYNTIINSSAAFKIVQPNDYTINIRETKEAAAECFYKLAQLILEKPDRSNALKAYTYFKICDYYVPGYKEVKSKINIAFGRAVINVVIDSLEDHSYYTKVDTNEKEFVSFNDLFQENLKTELQDDFLNSKSPIAFYTNKDALANNVRVDWIINLDFETMRISASNATLDNPPPVPDGYVAENIVTYIIPNFGAQDGQHHPVQTFGNNDVFTYPSPPHSLLYDSNNYDVFVNGVLSLKIKDKKMRANISSRTLSTSYQLPKTPTHYSGQIAAHNTSLQKLFIKFYPQIEETINKALN